MRPAKHHDSLFHNTFSGRVTFEHPGFEMTAQRSLTDETANFYSQIKLSRLHFLVPFSNPSCPLRFYQYSGDRASHYAAPTTLALSLLVTDRPAIVPATVQCALTLNSLAGRLPVSASSRNTRRLGSHEGNLESTCHCRWRATPSP